MATTVQQFLAKAVAMIDDTQNLGDYNTGYFAQVSQVVGELMRLRIGIGEKVFTIDIGNDYTPAYTPTDADYKPITLPTALTSDEQILSVYMSEYGDNYPCDTEFIGNRFYLLIPVDYRGQLSVRYMTIAPTFTALTETIPLTDQAINAVGAYGLAALLSVSNNPMLTTYFEQKYATAKREWKRPSKVNTTQIIDVYDIHFR